MRDPSNPSQDFNFTDNQYQQHMMHKGSASAFSQQDLTGMKGLMIPGVQSNEIIQEEVQAENYGSAAPFNNEMID
jgi:hypothetical protein